MTVAEAIQLCQFRNGDMPAGEPNVWVGRVRREGRLARIFYPCIRLEELLGGREYLYLPGARANCFE